jgi:hypothetical protein
MSTPETSEWTREKVAEMYGYAQTTAENLRKTLEVMDRHSLPSVEAFSKTILKSARGFQTWATQTLSSANTRSTSKGS